MYWDCQKLWQKECRGRAVTNDPQEGQVVIVHKGPAESPHDHAPNWEEVRAAALTQNLKRKVAANPGQPPTQILRTKLAQVGPDVLSQLPEREALAKVMRRERRRNLPTNPRLLLELDELPERFKYTLLHEKFLIYDSRQEESEEDDDRERVLVFSTSRNIELLCNSPTWFLDGTFKTSPTLFTQIFTVLELRKRNVAKGAEVALPLSMKLTNETVMSSTSSALCRTTLIYK